MQPHSAVRTRRFHGLTSALCAGTLLLLAASGAHAVERDASRTIVGERAFVVTESEALAPFTFDRVVGALTGGQAATWIGMLAATQTNGRRRQVVMPLARFIANTESGYWRPAGTTGWSHVRLIAIVNRFDLAAPDYTDCGEYRLVFSRSTEGTARLHIAIETVLPNPDPPSGRRGCAAVAEFWWGLALTESVEARRQHLQRFFFEGLPPYRPALDSRSFETRGRVRTTEIGDGRPRFRQYEWKRHCATARPCAPKLSSVALDNMPDGSLFDAGTGDRVATFRREFLRQVGSLSIPDVNRYFMNIDRAYSVSDVEALVPAFNYRLPFRRSLQTDSGRAFREQIAEELRNADSTLSPEDIISRAETQNCAGCHGKPGPVGGGVVFPNAFESGEHIADDPLLESILSPALQDVYLPYRIDLLRDYLRTAARSTVATHRQLISRETANE